MGGCLRIGDTSNHGNIILTGSKNTTIGGVSAAHVGSGVSGDSHKHPANSITTSGNAGMVTVGGRLLASAGASTACGASISASQKNTLVGG